MYKAGQYITHQGKRARVVSVDDDTIKIRYSDLGDRLTVCADDIKPLRKSHKEWQTFIPTGYRRVTIEDVKRWQAMEARLDDAIKDAIETPVETLLEKHDQRLIVDMLQFIKDGKDED